METTINATTDFLHAEIAKKDAYIKQLESAHANAVTRSTGESAERNRMRDEMKDWTLNALTERLVSESDAEEIASICGFELTNEFELEVTVQYSITVNARDEESAINSIHEIDFDSVSYNSDEIAYLSSSVDRVDI